MTNDNSTPNHNILKPFHQGAWTAEEDNTLLELYASYSRAEIADILGRSAGSVRKRCSVLHLNTKRPAVTQEVLDLIEKWYRERKNLPVDLFDLDSLSALVHMDKSNVSRIARKMGLTSYGGDYSAEKNLKNSARLKEWHVSNIHPRGFLGKHHSAETKRIQSIKTKMGWEAKTPLDVEIRNTKMLKTRIERYGSGNPSMRGQNPYSRTKSGKRADLNNQFFRSAWEANYARYLNWQVEQQVIKAWEFEPQTFVFHGVTRGVLTYTPDFKVIDFDGSYEWHEVKGWMDDKSKAKLKRMAKFYPEEKVIIIDKEAYTAISKWKSLFSEWE